MQQVTRFQQVTLITPSAQMSASVHGGRAKCLQRLIRLDLPVPRTVALSFDAVRAIASGRPPPVDDILDHFGEAPLLSVRPSSEESDWGGPGAILNIGMSGKRLEMLEKEVGEEAAISLYLRFIQSYSVHVARLDPDLFHLPASRDEADIARMLRAYEDETDEPFPESHETQLAGALRAMARAWEGTSARLLRMAKGAPADAGLGLVVQKMALGVGRGVSGSGVIQFVDADTGRPRVTGRYLGQSQGREALQRGVGALYLTRDPRGESLEEAAPDVFEYLMKTGSLTRARLREEMQVEFTISGGEVHILDAVRLPRSARAAVKIAVSLAEDGIIPREEAVMRVSPSALPALLHHQVDPVAERQIVAKGIAASPGAACGRLVFTAEESQAGAARGEATILIRRETTPEDIRGMHAAHGVVTIRGGITSHAAVIGRGLGLPCVVGAAELQIDKRGRRVIGPGGTVISAGEMVTVDGTSGQLLKGEVPLIEAQLGGAFAKLLDWADAVRDIGVRANADTPADAQVARRFAAEGIGLCRTEHMFFEDGRIGLMREMIFAGTADDRRAVLDRLLPLQRADFTALFEIMAGQPVCIRLFDPPLHEFLPSDKAAHRELAESLGLPLADVTARIEALAEYNPMLGMRGVRLGIAIPEIYEMQARAIFEAAVQAVGDGQVVPEIMIPLVSAAREVELVKSMIDGVAAAVRAESGVGFDYRLGVMVETPRAALRAADIALHAAFLSFGTNDLTQMTYGLSRDDAGRFMSAYVQQGVYAEDPFHLLDTDGVGELLQIGASRGRRTRPDMTLALCGEHGGSARAIAFVRAQGFTYVSCSPFRVPVARLAAAQLVLQERAGGGLSGG